MSDKIPFPTIFDGAFATYFGSLYGSGGSCELANITDPDKVKAIHTAYIEAGAQAVKTNTFGANRNLSDRFDTVKKVIECGVLIAKEAAGSRAEVYADIGCIYGDREDKESEYLEIAKVFLSNGCTKFLFETLEEFLPLLPAIRFIRENCQDAVILVSFAVAQDGYTGLGNYYKTLIKEAVSCGLVDAAGLNCVCGPAHIFTLLSDCGNLEGFRLLAMPNAGYPSTVSGRKVFLDNAAYFSQKAVDFIKSGITIFGGCCGTTPDHIRESVKLIRQLKEIPKTRIEKSHKDAETVFQNTFYEKLKSGKKVLAIELNPPVISDFSFLSEASRKAKAAGADIITVTDSPMSRIHADSFLTSVKIKREAGIDVLPHLSCRDRNQIAIKGALISANIEGVDNLLVITGDPLVQSEKNGYKGVFSFNSHRLLAYISSLNQEVFSSRPFVLSAALNLNALNFEEELLRAQKKIDSGASYFLTQPVFSEQSVERLKLSKQRLNTYILAGILPVAGYKNAVFLNNEVSGIDVPNELIAELSGKTAEQAEQISLNFSKKIIDSIYGISDGIYLMTPLKRIEMVCKLIKYLRSKK